MNQFFRIIVIIAGIKIIFASVLFAQTITGSRSLPDFYVPGGNLDVFITFDVDEANQPNGLIVREMIPIDWELNYADPVNHVYIQTEGLIKWLYTEIIGRPVVDGTIHYNLFVPVNENEVVTFYGELLYNDPANGYANTTEIISGNTLIADDAGTSDDSDGDGIPDSEDACPNDPENDIDGDGVCGDIDNCPYIANNNQSDVDLDNIGDVCDDDIDGDTVLNEDDNCPYDENTEQTDTDGDGAGDVCDADDDNDGVLDADDACVPTPLGEVVNETGCSIADLCPCDNPWKNHGAYVRCVAHTSEDFISSGLITEAEKDDIVSWAAESICGHKK